jgi:NAD(P)-dependent dehydrogenase (short-subunit alcohol dehydrogenase family)
VVLQVSTSSGTTLSKNVNVLISCLGIGLEYVRILQSQGCSVVIGDLQFPDGAKEIAKKGGAKVLFKKTDVTNWTELTELFSWTERELGAPDIVALSAGKAFTPEFHYLFVNILFNRYIRTGKFILK